MLGPSNPWGNSKLCSVNPFRKTTRGPTVHQGSPRAFGSPKSARFFLQKLVEKGHSKEHYHIGLAKYETAIKQGGPVTRRLRSKLRSTSSSLHARQTLGQKPIHKEQDSHTVEASPRRNLRCGHGRQHKNLKFGRQLLRY